MNGRLPWNDAFTRRNVMSALPVALGGLLLAATQRVDAAAAPAQGPSAGPANATILEDLVVSNRILVDKGFLDTSGHVSVRHDRNPNRYLMAWRRAPELIVAEDIMEHDLDNNVIDANGRTPYRERFIHSAIYKVRPDVQAIVHGHTPSLVAFSSSHIPLQALFGRAAFIGKDVPVFVIGEGGGIVGTPELGDDLARTLGNGGALLMRQHGVVVVGRTLPELVSRSINLDTNAQLQARILAMGDTPIYVPPRENTGTGGRAPDNTREWEAYKRRALMLMKEK
jgi:ribulose-5-phosphate 4-epimerase/fuculose-1-phosphate aldolase